MLVLSPWSDPIPLTRAWCLWEILCAMDQDGVELVIRLPRSQRRGFHQGLVKNYDMVLKTLMRVDAERAEAFKASDRDMIFLAIKETVGFAKLNQQVKDSLRVWFLDTAVEITGAMRK
eukprot:UC1_evm1s1642